MKRVWKDGVDVDTEPYKATGTSRHVTYRDKASNSSPFCNLSKKCKSTALMACCLPAHPYLIESIHHAAKVWPYRK
jgi:hypothetical protein